LINFIPVVNHSLKYNPSIDGLRGIAISLVLLFHIWPEYFSFGYVGVDIFFVLSGYLITQIIFTKLESNTFSLKEFYRNRVRRIFPSLIVVLATTLLIGYLFMFPMELEQLGRHIKSSAFFYENFRLIGEVGYWDESAILKPLLHFWSLAIEEQFYIFWPLILILLYKTRLNIVLTLSILFLVLFIIPLITEFDKFYHTLSRAWELSLGGLVFIISYKYKNIFELLNKYKNLIYSAFFISIAISYNNISFSTYKTFLIVFFSALLILSLSRDKSKTIFSNSILVFIGLISFPLYLWHYVIISFTHIFGFEINLNIGLILIFSSIFLSYLTYRYIEIYARVKSDYKFALGLFIIVLALGFLGNFTSKKAGLPNRTHLESNENFEKQFIKPEPKNEKGIKLITEILNYTPEQSFLKSVFNINTDSKILVAGDSHAYVAYEGIAQEYKKKGINTLLFGTNSCSLYNGVGIGISLESSNLCTEKSKEFYKFVEKTKFSKIFLFSRGPKYIEKKGFGKVDNENSIKNLSYFNNLEHEEQFWLNVFNTMEYFSKENTEIYIVLENPELGFVPKNYCINRPFKFFEKECKLDYNEYIERMRKYKSKMMNLAKNYNNIHVIDIEQAFCDKNYCYGIKDGKMLYSDDDHLSIDGSIHQAKFILKKISDDN
jgi:peptidoglycan/LPS O-acetylase OafA/YrhL